MLTTEEIIKNRSHLLKEHSHKYTQGKDDTTDQNDVQGFWDLTKQQQITLVNYCLTAFKPIKRINPHYTSYGLKHRFEHYPYGFYVYNGQFKAGMLLAGYLPKDKRELNWCYSISKQSPGIAYPENKEEYQWYQFYLLSCPFETGKRYKTRWQ